MLSAVMSITQSFQASDVTAQQSEEWSWTSGKFEYRNGQILIKEQSETPADVWFTVIKAGLVKERRNGGFGYRRRVRSCIHDGREFR